MNVYIDDKKSAALEMTIHLITSTVFVKYNITSQIVNIHFSQGHTEPITCSVSVMETG